VKQFRALGVLVHPLAVTEHQMDALQKVLVVDDGARSAEHALSIELAELGFASVTTSLEATDDVLEMLPAPAAILLHLPRGESADHDRFMQLAARLRARKGTSGIPIILVDPSRSAPAGGGYASVLQSQLGVGPLNRPDR
jgi:hypothetical protein